MASKPPSLRKEDSIMLLSIVIPVYNEEATLSSVVSRIVAVPVEKQIIIVDDCSTDKTPEIIQALERQYGSLLRVFRHEANQGKGAAIRTGLAAVEGDIVIIQDADLEYHPEDYPVALRLIEKGWADAVYGSRFLGPHRVFHYKHYLANKFLTFLVNVTSDTILTDMETGFKMFRTGVLKSLSIESSRFDFEVEVTIKLLRGKFRVYEIPITYTGRTFEEGKKITWKDGVHALFAIVKWTVFYRKPKK
jgi:glycosyltransferase involved in cell wall biosynthesis